ASPYGRSDVPSRDSFTCPSSSRRTALKVSSPPARVSTCIRPFRSQRSFCRREVGPRTGINRDRLSINRLERIPPRLAVFDGDCDTNQRQVLTALLCQRHRSRERRKYRGGRN